MRQLKTLKDQVLLDLKSKHTNHPFSPKNA